VTAPRRLAAAHDIADHTSELLVRLRAGSLADLMAEAGRALAEIQLRETGSVAEGAWRAVEVSASDPAGLLADWLNELIYLGETERWVATEFDLEAAGAMLRGRARGVTLGQAPVLVKAATLHGVRVDRVPGGLTGEVILDI